MFKYISQYAQIIANVDIYPIISLLIFFLFFMTLLMMVNKMKKEWLIEVANIPFENEVPNHHPNKQ